MEFWSKGLGKRTIALELTGGDAVRSEGTVCLRGKMEEPVSWEYIMKLTDDDIIDFFSLLKGEALPDFLFDSPHRWTLYRDMVVGGLQLGLLVLAAVVRRILGREAEVEDISIQVPPPVERKRKRTVRRRLSTQSTAAPTVQAAEEGVEPVEAATAGAKS